MRIRRLLVANRSEIARRVFATCRRAGIETVAVFSDADADSPHVREADLAVRLPGHTPAETYLRGDLIVAAAQRVGADAVHPGYGFLSENADLAAAVTDGGLVWVGPPPKAIAAMGSKLEAKALLAEAGVPMLESWTRPDEVAAFPVLVKASAGGGGRGMRIARAPADLADAISAARREAGAAFGDDTVFCERYVESGRHVEVQILADNHGTVVALGERDCSIQRRHQKIIEEAPAPDLEDALRQSLWEAGVAAARAVGYVGAGTVEFLLAPDGRFYFLEMNTRLQVEHPVTECVLGLDLVGLQLLVAEGRELPFAQAPQTTGHAIEVRLYAEDAAHGWRPSTGTVHRFDIGAADAFTPLTQPGVRLDSGVVEGFAVSVHYDPMLAKVIAWAPTRADAARALASALAGARIHGVVTNRDLLVRVLRSDEFLRGGTDTAFLDRHPEVFEPIPSAGDRALASLAAALAGAAARRVSSPWAALPSGWRNLVSAPQVTVFDAGWGRIEVRYRLDRDGALATWSATVDGDEVDQTDVTIVAATPARVTLDVEGVRRTFSVERVGQISYVDSLGGSVALTDVDRFPLPTVERPAGSMVAPMPGTVGRVAVAIGQIVEAGALLLTLEAMKLEHPVHAPEAGVVTELLVQMGSQVEAGTVLAVVAPEPPPRSDPTDLTEPTALAEPIATPE
jgi:propionyl-CoA carboxylase alpha chain